jgi:NAD(P)-dependent dehydrogenase (short-subunit alcohol dehydrogenase family)
MHGKVVVVTGASGALGKVVAAAALARGARVAGLDHAAVQVPATDTRIELGGVDLSDAAAAEKAIETVAVHFGRLDVLLNIAGGFAFEPVAEGDVKTWQRMYMLNVLTALNASRSALAHLAASPSGRIVNVGAMGALQAGASMPKADFGKWVTPEELANVILFLASDAASAITGALIPVNGRV